ncbi:uncharacterized protein LOC134815271 [Bolinopsis microptera]|uniref:uncharacterized protein LOC134815271 n=1 Tax=Bolinopsis microptera TaxID=2820187 RepID=UPI00307A8D42
MELRWALYRVMAQCGLFVCMVTSFTPPQDSCSEIGTVLTERFQRHTSPEEIQNLFTCNKGLTCCNTVSEYFFEKRVTDDFTKFALYTLHRRIERFNVGAFAEQVNWAVFRGLIKQVEDGLPISYEHFFELALFEIVAIKPTCIRRKEVVKLKEDAMPDIIKLVNNIYAYQKGVQAINVTLLATASLRPSKKCSNNVSKAGIPLDLTYRPAGCPLCLDSTAQAKVCRDLCLNVVRGCYASILLYKDLYSQLIKKMDEIYFTLNYHLEMQNGSLFSFMGKIDKYLKSVDFTRSCTDRDFGKKRRRKRQGGSGPDLSHFENYFSKTLDLESAIVDPATLPCAGSNNTTPCWNGDGMGNYQHLAYSYTKEEQEINPETADMELTELQESAVRLMVKALELANRTSLNEKLFNVSKSDPETEGTSEPPVFEKKFETLSSFTTPGSVTTERPSVEGPIKANTKAPEGELSNTVESDLDPMYNMNIADTNARQVDEFNDDTASSESNSDNRSVNSVTLGGLFLYTFLVVAR